MTNESDINEVLRAFNQEALLKKKKVDIDNIVDSILLFFNNYFGNLSKEVTIKLKSLNNISEDDYYGVIINKMVFAFFNVLENKLKETTTNKFNSIRDNIPNLTDLECNKKLNYIVGVISNEISDFYLENAEILIKELIQKEEYVKVSSDYLIKVVYGKVINTLKDRLMYSIKVIDNNNEENKEKIETINEKTINKV